MYKRFLKLLLIAILTGTQFFVAPSNAEIRNDYIESTGGEVEVVIEQQPNLPSQELEVELAVAIAEDEHSPLVIQAASGREYNFDYITKVKIPDENASEQEIIENGNVRPEIPLSRMYYSLDASQRQSFQENRLLVLSKAATILDRKDLSIGFGTLTLKKLRVVNQKVTSSISNTYRRLRGGSPTEQLALEILPDDQETPKTVRETGQMVVASTLQSIDRLLWSIAPLVSRQNEFGGTVSVNALIEAGKGSRGIGGAIGIGFSFSYNRDLKTLAFELFTEIDRFKKGVTPFFSAGIIPKIGFIVKDIKEGEETTVRNGTTNYPPAPPNPLTLAGFLSTMPDTAVAGVSISALSFPPFIGDAFWYINKTTRKPILRVSISAFDKKFIRVQTGLPKGVLAKITNVKGMTLAVKTAFKKGADACRSLLKK